MLLPCLVTGAFLPLSLTKIIRKKDEWKNNYTWQKIQNDNESESESCSVVSDPLWPHELYSPWNSPGQNTGVGSFSFLQGIFPTRGSNPGLPHCRWILYQLSHQGSPSILEWLAYAFSSESSWPRNWTRVSCIAGRFFTSWATRKAWGGMEDVQIAFVLH